MALGMCNQMVIQSLDVCCFLHVARTVAQHCMEGMGEEKLYFPLLIRY